MTTSQQERQQRDISILLGGHSCSERLSRSFDFRQGRQWAYAFSLTWTPGTLTITGDVGEMTLSNHSLRDLIGALEWAQHSDIDYLLSKSNVPYREYCPVATFDELVHMANERAAYSAKALRDELRDWRRSMPDVYAWEDMYVTSRDWSWNRHISEYDAWKEAPPEGFKFDREFPRKHGRLQLDQDLVDVPPDGWEIWNSLREELCPWLDPTAIFTAKGRKEIKRELRRELDARHDAIDLIQRCAIDDYYGSEVITPQAILRISCIRHGAWLALLHLEPERMYEWSPASIYDRDMRAAFPQTAAALQADHQAEIARRRAERIAA